MNDILVKVGGLVFLADFAVLENEDAKVLISLGRPFLATSQALLDIQDRKITLYTGDEEAIFKLLEPMKHPMEHNDTSYSIHDTDMIICDYLQEVLSLNPLEEYFEEENIGKLEREPLEKSLRKQPELMIASPKKKSDG